jgi:hypothetical protein
MVEWLPLTEAAERLGMSRSALHRAHAQGRLKGKFEGRRLLIAVDDAGGMHPGTNPGMSRPRGAAVRDDATQMRLFAQRAALAELEVERARLTLEAERARHAKTHRLDATRQSRDRAVKFAALLMPHAPRQLSQPALERFTRQLELMCEQVEPEAVTPVTIAELLREALIRDAPRPVVEEEPSRVSPLLMMFLASRLGLL